MDCMVNGIIDHINKSGILAPIPLRNIVIPINKWIHLLIPANYIIGINLCSKNKTRII